MKRIGELTDRQILIAQAVDMRWVKKTLSNHLRHHQSYEVALVIGVLLLIAERLFSVLGRG